MFLNVFCPACENFSDKTGMVYPSKSCVIEFQELGNKGAESEKYQVGIRKIKCNNPQGKIFISGCLYFS